MGRATSVSRYTRSVPVSPPAEQIPSPPGNIIFRAGCNYSNMFPRNAGKKNELGTQWSKFLFSPCREYNCRFRVCSYRLPQGNRPCATACHEESKASSPLPITGRYSLEGIILSNRLAASRKHTLPCIQPLRLMRFRIA